MLESIKKLVSLLCKIEENTLIYLYQKEQNC